MPSLGAGDEMSAASAVPPAFANLPLAELHLHLEGSIAPATVVELAARHGTALSLGEAVERYSYSNFVGFIEAFKWVTRLVREPEDFALITRRLGEELLRQSVVYAEITISAGVMLLREQDIVANFAAIAEAGAAFQARGLKLAWIFDVVRQFGGEPALAVARAASLQSAGVIAFGIGGDELSVPASEFRAAFDYARDAGLHIVAHAGEIGGPDSIREAIAVLGAERIGHGIAAINDPALCDELAARAIPLEICPTSNLATGALALQTGKPLIVGAAARAATLADHPLKKLYDRGLCVTLSTDDPAMFHTNLRQEYAIAASLGFSAPPLVRLAENGFHAAFLPPDEKFALLRAFRERATVLGLL
jgi:adenosine deaminase/aminodeoxyfutalosine deaminase